MLQLLHNRLGVVEFAKLDAISAVHARRLISKIEAGKFRNEIFSQFVVFGQFLDSASTESIIQSLALLDDAILLDLFTDLSVSSIAISAFCLSEVQACSLQRP